MGGFALRNAPLLFYQIWYKCPYISRNFLHSPLQARERLQQKLQETNVRRNEVRFLKLLNLKILKGYMQFFFVCFLPFLDYMYFNTATVLSLYLLTAIQLVHHLLPINFAPMYNNNNEDSRQGPCSR